MAYIRPAGLILVWFFYVLCFSSFFFRLFPKPKTKKKGLLFACAGGTPSPRFCTLLGGAQSPPCLEEKRQPRSRIRKTPAGSQARRSWLVLLFVACSKRAGASAVYCSILGRRVKLPDESRSGIFFLSCWLLRSTLARTVPVEGAGMMAVGDEKDRTAGWDTATLCSFSHGRMMAVLGHKRRPSYASPSDSTQCSTVK